jgi:hypothetical protein
MCGTELTIVRNGTPSADIRQLDASGITAGDMMRDTEFIVPPLELQKVLEMWAHHAGGCGVCFTWDLTNSGKPCPFGLVVLCSFHHLLHSLNN